MANNNPWLALSTYEEKDKDKFKGREKDTENVITMLQQSECVVCYAASGDGKSSLINAGVCPAIRKLGMFPLKLSFTTAEYEGKGLPQRNNGQIDFDKLFLIKIEEGIEHYEKTFVEKYHITGEYKIDFERVSKFPETNASNKLWLKFRTETIQMPYGEFAYVPVLIFDQFEEMFRSKWKAEFFKWMEQFMKDVCPDDIEEIIKNEITELPSKKLFKVIFSLRYEYVGELDYWCSQKTFIPQLMQNRYFLKPLSKEQAMSVIRTQNVNDPIYWKMRDEADLIVNNIIFKTDNSGNDIEGLSGVVLSLVCFVLYEKWKEDISYSLDDINLNDIIYDFYLGKLHKIGIIDDSRHVIEDVLISPQNIRLRMPISDSRLQEIDISKYIFTEEGIPSLKSEHLIKIETINGEDYIEFVHDRLSDSIFLKREVERKEEYELHTVKSKQKIALYPILCLLLFLFFYLTYASLKENTFFACDHARHYDNNRVEVSDDNYHEQDYSHATSIKYISKLYDNTDFYENVIYKERVFRKPHVYYAHNAKKLVFALPFNTLDNINSLDFGENTEEVILFNPNGIKNIHCVNKYTKVYVLYGYFDKCIKENDLKNVHFQELGQVSTFIEKIKYELYRVQKAYEIPLLFVIITIFIMLVWISSNTWKKHSGYKRVAFILLPMFIFAFLFVVNAELIWLKKVNNIDLMFLLCLISLFYLIPPLWQRLWRFSLSFNGGKLPELERENISDSNQMPYNFVYCSEEGRDAVIQLRQALIDTRMEGDDDDFGFDPSIVRYGDFRPEIAAVCISKSNRCVALFVNTDFYDIDRIKKYTSVINKAGRIPVIVIVGSDNLCDLNVPAEVLPFFERADLIFVGKHNHIEADSAAVVCI